MRCGEQRSTVWPRLGVAGRERFAGSFKLKLSVDLVPTNGKRMVCLDHMSPRGREQASHALYGACGRFGEPLGASWGLRRASNGFEHGLPARTVKRFGTVSVQVLDVAPRGFPLAEKSLPTAQGTCGRLSAAAGSRARALWALRVAIPAPHELIVYRSFWSELSTLNNLLKVGP